MNRQNTERTGIAFLLVMRNFWPCMLLLIALTGLSRACFVREADPMDRSFLKSQHVVDDIIVADSASCGFRVVYVTAQQVTGERVREIRRRPHVIQSMEKLKKDAPACFGSMLDTNIYDFARFARQYDADPAVEIHNIFIHGRKKIALYEAPNPRMKNPAKYISLLSLQGVQYLNRTDVYSTARKQDRVYRYWKCGGIHACSKTDERFIHFTEDGRIE